ncbi:YifB family Mg chelatase-like AAA ATPase [Bacillus tianshenii]|nr:YifB family Mg chelatase-like AAA ATPase [Bacillus tianshenii]
MAVTVKSIGLKGLEGYTVHVEVQMIPGMEAMSIVGLPDTSVKESKERVLAALHSFGVELPDKKIIINLSPAEQKKNGPMFDLAMAIGILKSVNHFAEDLPAKTAFLGALSLDGTIRPVEGMLPAIMAAKKNGIEHLYLPFDENLPLEYIDGVKLHFVQHLQDVIHSLTGQQSLQLQPLPPSKTRTTIQPAYDQDFKHIIGHEQAKRAMEIAAAGGHHLLMSGPPGCGKSLLAQTFQTILPPLTNEAKLETISLYQLAGAPLHSTVYPPFRNPHHSASSVAIIGGGSYPKPGEVSLAHHGVLFLDEMAEFTKKTLDMLRQPLETSKVTISRAHSTVTYPAKFILIGAMNPCPCGHLGSQTHYCTCSPKQVKAYQNRVSGPIHDRMDLLLSLRPVNMEAGTEVNEDSETVRERVTKARHRQYERYQQEQCNAEVSYERIEHTTPLTTNQKHMLQQLSTKQHWSNRVQVKIIRLARTIADLQDEEHITDEALWEAMTYRRMNKHDRQKKKA